jgi:hypothetical protein
MPSTVPETLEINNAPTRAVPVRVMFVAAAVEAKFALVVIIFVHDAMR